MENIYVFTDFETTGLDPERYDVPIEIGMIFTDSNYNIIDVYKSVIDSLPEHKGHWDEYEIAAFKVHNIPVSYIKNEGAQPARVVNDILKILSKREARYIIVSDNAVFEYGFMKKLFNMARKDEFPFYHIAFDLNILMNITDIQKRKLKHRAFEDVCIVYKTAIRCLEKLGFKKWDI